MRYRTVGFRGIILVESARLPSFDVVVICKEVFQRFYSTPVLSTPPSETITSQCGMIAAQDTRERVEE